MTTFKSFYKADFVAPSVPQNLSVDAVDLTTIDLSWDASTDDVSGVAGYRLYRDSGLITDQPGLSFQDSGLDLETSYTYNVMAYDNEGNESLWSSDVIGTTLVFPIAVNDSKTADENLVTTMNLASNDTAGSNPLDLDSIIITQAPTNGTIDAVNANGTVDYNQSTPGASSDLFKYTIDDTNANTSNVADVNVTVRVKSEVQGYNGASGSSNTNISMTRPSNTSEGDYIFAFLGVDNAGNEWLNGPAGWTRIERWTTASTKCEAWYKIATASEPSNYTWTWSNTSSVYAGVIVSANGSSFDVISGITDFGIGGVSAGVINSGAVNSLTLRWGYMNGPETIDELHDNSYTDLISTSYSSGTLQHSNQLAMKEHPSNVTESCSWSAFGGISRYWQGISVAVHP